jgi:prevent-host-death family protein
MQIELVAVQRFSTHLRAERYVWYISQVQAINAAEAQRQFTALVKDAAAGEQYYVLTNHGRTEAVLIGYNDWREGCKELPVAKKLQQTTHANHARAHLADYRKAAHEHGIHTLLTTRAGTSKNPDNTSAVLAPYPWVVDALDARGPINQPDPTPPAGPTLGNDEPANTPHAAIDISANQARAGFTGYVKDAATGQQFLLRNRGRIEAILLGYPHWLDLCTTHPVDQELQQTMGVIAARDHLGECRTAAHISGIHTLITADADKHTDPNQALKAVIAPYSWSLNALNADNPTAGTS